MANRRIVFFWTEKKYIHGLGELLGSIQQSAYHFVILPKTVEAISKDELVELLKQVCGSYEFQQEEKICP